MTARQRATLKHRARIDYDTGKSIDAFQHVNTPRGCHRSHIRAVYEMEYRLYKEERRSMEVLR